MSAANNLGMTQFCIATLPPATPTAVPVNATSITNGGSYSLVCQDNGLWAESGSTSSCPAPANVSCAATTKTIVSAFNNVNATQTCVASLPVSSPSATAVVASPVTNGGSYSLVCQSSGQWTATPTISSCPAPATVSPTITWTTSPAPIAGVVSPTNRTLTFSVQPATGVTISCYKKALPSGMVSNQACTTTSIVASSEGNYSYYVEAKIGTGPVVTSTAIAIAIDKTVPTLSLAPTIKSADGKTFTFKLLPSEPPAYVIYKLDQVLVSSAGLKLEYAVTLNDFIEHQVEFVVVDGAGNRSLPATASFKQTAPPEATYNSLANGLLLNRTNDDRSGQPGNGSTISWDGKLMIRTTGAGWETSVFRPQLVKIGATHDVDLSPAFSPTTTILKQRFKIGSNSEGYGAYDSTNFAYMLYRILLNREPESSTVISNIVSQLEGGTASPEGIYNGFLASEEYQQKVAQDPNYRKHPKFIPSSKFTEINALAIAPYYTDRAFVLDAYQNILGRPPDPGGYDYWMDWLNTPPNTREGLLNAFEGVTGAIAGQRPHKFKNYSRLAAQENPYPSDVRGVYSASGNFKTYDVLLYTQVYKIFMFTENPYPYGRNLGLESLPGDTIGVMRYRFIIENPKTNNAKLSGYYLMDDFTPILANGAHVIGIEPTVTADGLLMAFNENRTQGVLKYLYTEDPLNNGAWSTPQHLTAMYLEKDKAIHGVKLGERYPLANLPILSPTGYPYAPSEGIKGAYPWISWEGSEIYFTSLVSKHKNPAVDARRAGASVVGHWTGNAVRLLDGFLNTGLLAYDKIVLFANGLGSTSSFWNPFKDIANPKLPFLYERPSVMLMGFNDNSYNDISFKEFVDGRYLVAWPMNEALHKINATTGSYGLVDFTKTPDLSGHFNTGTLLNGARFQSESGFGNSNDNHVGYKGQAIIFPTTGSVNLAWNNSFLKLDSFTVEAFIQPKIGGTLKIAEFGDGSANSILLSLDSGRVSGSIKTNSGFSINSGSSGVASFAWSHVAMTYNHMNGVLKLYINGKMVAQTLTTTGSVAKPAGSFLRVGPNMPFNQGDAILIDEFRLSSVARSSTEIADAAHLPYSQRFDLNFTLPPRITKSMLHIPDEQMISLRKVQLGSILFNDNRLSSNNAVSCSSCHSVSGNLSDSRQFSLGLNGNSLTRHSPTAFNRGLASTQMWDGKFSSLHAQTLGPLLNPIEMGMTAPALLAKINSVPAYVTAFNLAYGQPPNLNNLEQALSGFLSIMMTANNSPVDQFEINGTGLNSQQLRGRKLFYGQARCSACHSGSNYTDEQLHNVGFFSGGADTGKFALTGRPVDMRNFKAPSLRNIAQTAPYMHDGSLSSLEAVIVKYNLGSLTDAARSAEIKALNLSPTEMTDLAEFLRALNSPVTSIVPGLDTNSALKIEQYVQGL